MDWKEHANLFANGAFKILWEPGGKYLKDVREVQEFKGWAFDTGEGAAFLVEPDPPDTNQFDYIFPVNCTLIARRIEDMDSEELLETYYIADSHADVNEYDEDEWRQVLTQWAKLDDLSFATARQLLSYGVYPGPQSHFGETVIDINEV